MIVWLFLVKLGKFLVYEWFLFSCEFMMIGGIGFCYVYWVDFIVKMVILNELVIYVLWLMLRCGLFFGWIMWVWVLCEFVCFWCVKIIFEWINIVICWLCNVWKFFEFLLLCVFVCFLVVKIELFLEVWC